MKNANILVPIDFSELSYKAFEVASVFAELFDGAITPFHSYLSLGDIDDPEHPASDTFSDAHEELAKRLMLKLDSESARHAEPSALNRGIIHVGNPSDAIIETAHHFDLIVMTSHGRTGVSRLIMGSVAEKVIRFAPVPVVVAGESSELKPLKRILLTTDFSDYSLKAVPFARSIATASGANLDIIHILSREPLGSASKIQNIIESREEQMQKLVADRFDGMTGNVRTQVLTTKRSIHEKITRISEETDYNLIVMATIGRTGLDYLRLGSTASNVVRHVKPAVFTVNPRRLKGAQKTH